MWSPTISLGSPVTIPESYIPDLTTRLSLYRRLSALEDEAEIEAMGAEIVDRFGPPPPEVDLLLKLVRIKALCRRAHVEKLDAGAKGMTLAFRDNSFANPTGLVKWVTSQGSLARVRPDMRIVVVDDFEELEDRLDGRAEDDARDREDRGEEGVIPSPACGRGWRGRRRVRGGEPQRSARSPHPSPSATPSPASGRRALVDDGETIHNAFFDRDFVEAGS